MYIHQHLNCPEQQEKRANGNGSLRVLGTHLVCIFVIAGKNQHQHRFIHW